MAEWNIFDISLSVFRMFCIYENNLKFLIVLLWSHLHGTASLEKASPLLKQNLFTCMAKFINFIIGLASHPWAFFKHPNN